MSDLNNLPEEMLNQAEISVLEFPVCVQKRPGMYLPNITHAIFEIFDNGVDEHLAGRCNKICFQSHGDDIFTLTDNGGGIPVTPHKDPKFEGLSQAEVAYTVLHAGGKFGEAGGYKTVTGGLHGVGASVVNALSEWLVLTVYTGGYKYEARFEKGYIVQNMHRVETCDKDFTGTHVTFKLDRDIWKEEQVKHKRIMKRFEQMSYLNPGLCIEVDIDVEEGERHLKVNDTYHHEDGIKAYVESMLTKREPISPVVYANGQDDDIRTEVAFAYSDSYSEEIYTFVNNISTEDGGDHLNGFKRGVSKVINTYALENGFIKENEKLEVADTLEGIVAVVSIKVHEPVFDGQGKSRIKMVGVSGPVARVTENLLTDFLDKNPNDAKKIMEKVLTARKARQSAQRARENARKNKAVIEGKSAKLSQCVEKDPAKAELWIAEGDSAGGSLKLARDQNFQAVLPIFGKIINVEKATVDKVLDNSKILEMLKSLKCGIGEDFDITRLRYHKIIIASDADVDGAHIKTLYSTYFYRYARPIIEHGYLYFSNPPLYLIKSGKEVKYAYSDKEKDAIVAEFNGNCAIQRYKGLGEMNPDQLWETTMDPERRVLTQITIEDAEMCEEIIKICMGDNVSIRREFIMENAEYAHSDI